MSRIIKGSAEYSLLITAEQLADIFWAMDSAEQAEFFNRVSEVCGHMIDFQLMAVSQTPSLSQGGREVMKTIGVYSAKEPSHDRGDDDV